MISITVTDHETGETQTIRVDRALIFARSDGEETTVLSAGQPDEADLCELLEDAMEQVGLNEKRESSPMSTH